MRRFAGDILELAWGNPIARVIIILLVVAGIVAWIWEQVQETKEGEAMREKDRAKGDSIWND
jgi:hypothetical protein